MGASTGITHEPPPVLTTGDIASVRSLVDLATLLRLLRRRQARQRGTGQRSYRELAARTGWSIGTVSGYFSGHTLPPTDRFDELVTLLGATPAERGWLATARDNIEERRRVAAVRSKLRSKGSTVGDAAGGLAGPTASAVPPASAAPVSAVPSASAASSALVAAAIGIPRQLPMDLASFVGRRAQLERLDAVLDHARTSVAIVALSGTAGVGKTALAVHWAHRVSSEFPDGQLYVDLRGFDPTGSVTSPATAIGGLLEALGVAPQQIPTDLGARVGLYRSLLAGRRVLLIVDNARDAAHARPFLPGSPGCAVVVTSRNLLAGLIAAEGAYPVAVDLMSAEEARMLLAARLGQERVATAGDAAVTDLVSRCARLPLALAIVAARVAAHPTFTLASLAAELAAAHSGLDSFASRDSATDIRAAFSCSYGGLSAAAAAMFRQLSLHPGPDVSAAAVASLTGTGAEAVRPLLAELVYAHLVMERLPGRFAMHDLLRTYAREQAHDSDAAQERRATEQRVLDHYLRTANQAALLMYPHRDPMPLPAPAARAQPEPMLGPAQARAWFATEFQVLVNLIEIAASDGFHLHVGGLAWALADYLDWRGSWRELAAVQRVAVRCARRGGDHAGQGHAHRDLARAQIRLRRHHDALRHLTKAVTQFRMAGDQIGQANSRLVQALALEGIGRHLKALRQCEQALALFVAERHLPGQARALNAAGWYHARLNDFRQSLQLCRQALAMFQGAGNRQGEAATWDSVGFAEQHLGEHAKAARSYRQAIELYRECGDRYHVADTLVHLGDNAQRAGDAGQAVVAWRQALGILESLRHPAAQEVRRRLGAMPDTSPAG
ncbi:MAG TPA: tetratricopeptide repeat protein [Micromonosporaceae bacterium]